MPPNDGSITSAELHTSSGLARPVVIFLGNVVTLDDREQPRIPGLIFELHARSGTVRLGQLLMGPNLQRIELLYQGSGAPR